MERRPLSSSSSSRNKSLLQTKSVYVDWKGLESKFHELLYLYSQPPVGKSLKTDATAAILPGLLDTTEGKETIGSEARKQHKERISVGLEALVEIALTETHTLVHNGDYTNAKLGGLLAVKFLQKIHGEFCLQQIEPLFLLAKSFQYTQQYEKAEEFLSVANWCIIKNNKCPARTKALLHQNYGSLYVAKGFLDKAVFHFSNCIYFHAVEHGSESVITSFGYYQLGNVFAMQGKLDKAMDFLQKVVDIWYVHLRIALIKEKSKEDDLTLESLSWSFASRFEQFKLNQDKKGFELRASKSSDPSSLTQKTVVETKMTALDSLDEEQLQEAHRMFENIFTLQSKKYGENIATGNTLLVYGLFLWWIGEIILGKEKVEAASKIFVTQLGEESDMNQQSKNILVAMMK